MLIISQLYVENKYKHNEIDIDLILLINNFWFSFALALNRICLVNSCYF